MWCQFCQAKSLISLFQHNIESVWLNKLSLFRWKMTRIGLVWLIPSLYKPADFLFCEITYIIKIIFTEYEKIAKNEKSCSFVAVVFCGYNHRCKVNEQNYKLYVMILENIWLEAKAYLMLCKKGIEGHKVFDIFDIFPNWPIREKSHSGTNPLYCNYQSAGQE